MFEAVVAGLNRTHQVIVEEFCLIHATKLSNDKNLQFNGILHTFCDKLVNNLSAQKSVILILPLVENWCIRRHFMI